MKSLAPISALVAVIGFFGVSDASAVDVIRGAKASAANTCIPALPAFEGVMRKRPLAVQNEGLTSAFVTCAFQSPVGTLLSGSFQIANTSTVAQTVSCTGVSGAAGDQNVYAVKTLELAPGSRKQYGWTAEDFGGVQGNNIPGGGFFAVSCNLPPETGIGRTDVVYSEDVGN